MSKTLKQTEQIRSNAHAAIQEKIHVGVTQVLVETRDLLKRVEALAEALDSASFVNNQHGPIPERGRVRVISAVDDADEVLGKDGVALAGAPNDGGSWDYTVLIDNLDETYVLPRSALKFLGWTVPAKDMFRGPAFRVNVDEQGNGSISPPLRKPRK
jgi:hypothetical protein